MHPKSCVFLVKY